MQQSVRTVLMLPQFLDELLEADAKKLGMKKTAYIRHVLLTRYEDQVVNALIDQKNTFDK